MYPFTDAENAFISNPHTPFSPVLSPSQEFLKNGATKIDTIKNWGISTYKCTRQVILEKVGKTDRTANTGDLLYNFFFTQHRIFKVLIFNASPNKIKLHRT